MNCRICNTLLNSGSRCDDIYDCQENLDERDGVKRGTWLIQWGKRINGRKLVKTDSRFVRWSKSVG